MIPTPVNEFKIALKNHRTQIGLWLGLADSYAAEICAGAGFDWLLIDGEHGPQSLSSILRQLQAIGGSSHPVLRVPSDDGAVLKQHLDLGAQTVLVPMIDTAEQAAGVVSGCRYPPGGVRGIGGARASRWGRYPRYIHEANEQVCVIVQVETGTALENLDEIVAVDGVDAVFIGPSDLAASLGHPGDAGHAEVRHAVSDAIRRIRSAGKAPGLLSASEELAHRYLADGAVFVAVGIDTHLLATQTSALATRFRTATG